MFRGGGEVLLDIRDVYIIYIHTVATFINLIIITIKMRPVNPYDFSDYMFTVVYVQMTVSYKTLA
jgi:hypothetical protein